MWIVLLAVAAAAAYWCVSTLLEVRRQAEGRTEEAGESTPAPVDLSPLAAVLEPAVDGLMAVLERQGAEGSITLHFPRELAAGSLPTASCQFFSPAPPAGPSDQELLAALGDAAALPAFSPSLQRHAAGVVSLTVELRQLDPAVRRLLCQFRTRGETIGQLAAALTRRRADLQAVYLAGDILLTQRPVGKTG